jgi:hypothetical protein
MWLIGMSADETTVNAREAPPPGEPPASEKSSARSISRRRLILIDVLIGVTALLSVVGIFAIWANRQLFNPDNWSRTSTQLLQNAAIRSATANYIVDELYANVDVAALIRSGLPPRFQPLAAPAAGALRNAAVQGAQLALTRPRVQDAWAQANRAADQTFVAIVEGGKGVVKTNGGVVTLNLAAVVNNIASRLGLPSDIASKLPPSIANLQIIKSNQLKFVQDAGNLIKGLALWLNILVPLLWLLAIYLARGHRRRTLMSVGFSILLVGVLVLLGRKILESQVTSSLVSDASLRPAVSAAVLIGTGMLSQIAGAFVLVGAVVVVLAWFAGPARIAVAARRAIAPFLRERPAWTFGIVATIMVLIFIWQPIPATSQPIGSIVFFALAMFGTEMLRRQTAEEFPDAQPGDATAAMRARINAWRGRRASAGRQAPPAATESLPDQLERLASMRDGGAITPEDYEAAKARLLAHPS